MVFKSERLPLKMLQFIWVRLYIDISYLLPVRFEGDKADGSASGINDKGREPVHQRGLLAVIRDGGPEFGDKTEQDADDILAAGDRLRESRDPLLLKGKDSPAAIGKQKNVLLEQVDQFFHTAGRDGFQEIAQDPLVHLHIHLESPGILAQVLLCPL